MIFLLPKGSVSKRGGGRGREVTLPVLLYKKLRHHPSGSPSNTHPHRRQDAVLPILHVEADPLQRLINEQTATQQLRC